MFRRLSFCLLLLCFFQYMMAQSSSFVKVQKQQFYLEQKPYYYIGTNYWYGGLLGLEKDRKRGMERLQKELDFLKRNGVTNLRVVAGAEGGGLVNGVERIAPPLQPRQGEFNESVLESLDLLLFEMAKRDMKAIIFLSNNWEWSGGFLQYLNWNGQIADSVLKRKLNWDELRDYTSKFYSCEPCVEDYWTQVRLLVSRINKYSNMPYVQDPAIMAWELANEPRPMRPLANHAYKAWISKTAALIKSLDQNHLVTTGHEGDMATDGDMNLFEAVHADQNIDYITIHIWPKNWGWFKDQTMADEFAGVINKTEHYIQKHEKVAERLTKPLVVEEFGLPRDRHSFSVASSTSLRDKFYHSIFTQWQKSKQNGGVIAGVNFWSFGGLARPIDGQVFWKNGDELMGDPPMEEQGLNSVFDCDQSTWRLISTYTKYKLQQDQALPAGQKKKSPANTIRKTK